MKTKKLCALSAVYICGKNHSGVSQISKKTTDKQQQDIFRNRVFNDLNETSVQIRAIGEKKLSHRFHRKPQINSNKIFSEIGFSMI